MFHFGLEGTLYSTAQRWRYESLGRVYRVSPTLFIFIVRIQSSEQGAQERDLTVSMRGLMIIKSVGARCGLQDGGYWQCMADLVVKQMPAICDDSPNAFETAGAL